MRRGLLISLWMLISISACCLSEKVFLEEPKSQLLPLGSTVPIEMSCKANVQSPTYLWMKDLEKLPEASDSKYEYIGGRLRINNPDENDVGGYQCLVHMSGGGVIVSNFGNVTLAYINDFQSVQTQKQISEGTGAKLECLGQGDHAPNNHVQYQWQTTDDDWEWRTYTSVSTDPSYYVSFRTGALYFANVKQEDADSYQCHMRARDWFLNGNKVEKISSKFPIGVTTSGSTSNPVSFLLTPSPITYGVLGGKLFLECFAEGNPTPTISWSKVGGGKMPRGQQKSGLYSIRALAEGDEGTYRCTATNGERTITTDTEIQFEFAPQWVQEIKSQSVDTTATAVLTCEAKGSPQVDIFWMQNGVKLEKDDVKVSIIASNLEESVLYINDFSDKDVGYYQCLARNSHGTILSSAKLSKNEMEPKFVNTFADVTASAAGSPISFPCEVQAAPPANIRWFKDGEELDILDLPRYGIDDKGLNIERVDNDDAGEFTCEASNFLGAINTTGQLEVYEGTTMESNSVAEDVYEAGDWITLWCKASYDQSLPLTWEWKFEGKTLRPFGEVGYDMNGNSLEILGSGSRSGMYECTAITKVGRASAEMFVNIQDVPNKPNDLKTEAKSAASVFLRWELPNSNFSPLLAEKVQGRLINDLAAPGEWFDARTDPEELTDHHGCLVTNLLAFNYYQFRVRASNTIGHGGYSDASDRVRTLAGEPLKIPQLLKGGGGEPGELVVEWQPMNVSDYGAESVSYIIKIWKFNTSEDGARTDFLANPQANRTIFRTNEDEIYEPYNARIHAQNSAGFESEWSEVSPVYSGEIPPVQNVTGVKLMKRQAYSFDIEWEPIENINGFTKGYKVSVVDWIVDAKMVQPETWYNYTTVDENPSIKVDNLTAINAYSYKIAPFNSAGDGPYSDWMGPYLTRKNPPSRVPKNLDLGVIEKNVEISWDPVQNRENEEPIEGYKISVWKDGQTREEARITKAFKTEVTLAMKQKTEYMIAVQAYNKGGDGPYSEVIRFSTTVGSSIKFTGNSANSLTCNMTSLITMFIMSLLMMIMK